MYQIHDVLMYPFIFVFMDSYTKFCRYPTATDAATQGESTTFDHLMPPYRIHCSYVPLQYKTEATFFEAVGRL